MESGRARNVNAGSTCSILSSGEEALMADRGRAKQSAKSGHTQNKKRWVATVTTDSIHPQKGVFTKDAATTARALASKKVSPKDPGSGMRLLTYFINRGGKGLSASWRRELGRAKKLLSQWIATKGSPRKKAA